MEIKRIEVKEGNKQMDVFIPQDPKDHSYNEYLEEAEIEKTREQLKKRPDKPVSKRSKGDIATELKERGEFNKRRKSDSPKKYW